MGSHVVNYIIVLFTIDLFMSNTVIYPVKGQCTVQSCEKGDSSNGITTEIQEIKDQQEIIISNFQAVDRRSQEQIKNIYEFLNTSYQQMKNQLDTVMINFQAIDRRLQAQDTCIKQIANNHKILNASHQDIKNLNASLQQIKDQQDNALTSLQAIDRRSEEQVQSIKFLNTSILQMGNQQETVLTSLRAIERRFQEQNTYTQQIASNHEILNVSHQEIKASLQDIKDQQDIAMTSLQAVDQRSQQKIQNISEFLNASFQQMGNQHEAVLTSLRAAERRSLEQTICLSQIQSISEFLNASFQQNENQQASAMTSLIAIDRRLSEHDIFVRNKTENILQLTKFNAFGTGDWIVIMHRFNGSLNFNRTWTEYRNGFGDKHGGEIWLGNERVHYLTSRFNCTLRIEVQHKSSGVWYYAEYSSFSLESENNRYTLRLSGFSGNSGDSITVTSWPAGYLYGMKFTTWDNDNDNHYANCASILQGGWWFNNCEYSCLTCEYGRNFRWHSLNHLGSGDLLQAARMMIKRN